MPITLSNYNSKKLINTSNYHSYFSYQEMTNLLKNLEETNPEIIKVTSYAKSHEERDIWVVKIYNEGAAGYATIHFDLYEGSFMNYNKIMKKEQIVHLDAGEYKEITFVFEDLILGQSYSPDAWVEYK